MSTDPGSPNPLVTPADKIAGSANPLNIVVTLAEKIAPAEELARARLVLEAAGYHGRALIPIPNGHIEVLPRGGLCRHNRGDGL